MMGRRFNLALAAFGLVAVYLFTLLLGVFAIVVYPVYKTQRPRLLKWAGFIAEEWLDDSEDTLNAIRDPSLHILIFDSFGNCLLHDSPIFYKEKTDFNTYLASHLPAVLNGEERFSIAPTYEVPRKWNQFCMIAGVPILEHGSAAGAVFLVRNLENLQEALLMYLLCFTVLYVLSAFVVVTYTRKKRKLEVLRQNYIDNVTHAMKTPVSSIKALSETLCDGMEPDPDQRRILYGMILRQANLQGHMVKGILELSNLQNGDKRIEKASVKVSEIFDPIIEKYTAVCDCVGVNLHVSDEIAHLPPLYTNAALVRELLEILLDNALKFVDEDGDVWIECYTGRGRSTICVRDNGIGISKEDMPHIFERFYKSGGKRNGTGNGLGLAIAKEIVEGLNEKIWVESEPGEGALFSFTVRLK